MALKRLLPSLVITFSIASSVYAWNPDIHRYESYDLERGPVFYEAYYPDGNEESHGNFHEKRYFDREAVLEKTYQVPSQLSYPVNTVRFDNYRDEGGRAEGEGGGGGGGGGSFARDTLDDRFLARTSSQPLDIKELSNLARTAISRDLENWNALENYLDRAKHRDPSFKRQWRTTATDPRYGIEHATPDVGNVRGPDTGRELYEEVREEPSSALLDRARSNEDRSDSMRRPITRDLTGGDTLAPFAPIRYRIVRSREAAARGRNEPGSRVANAQESGTIVDPYPTENIFAPRPQVINYIFSRRPDVTGESHAETGMSNVSVTRDHGDDLIRDETKKTEVGKDVKVTSIEVSEVPRHKTRHRHGEWPKRDYSHRRQA